MEGKDAKDWLITSMQITLHCEPKNRKLLSVTSPNANQFPKFFHWQTQ